MVARLDAQELELLREVVTRRRPEVLPLVDALAAGKPLAKMEREKLRQAVAGELCGSGLDANDEPTPRGLLLEHLIDRLGKV